MKKILLILVILLVGVSVISCNADDYIERPTANNCHNYRCVVYESDTGETYTITDEGAKKVNSTLEEYKLDAVKSETQGEGNFIKLLFVGDRRSTPKDESDTLTFFTYIVYPNDIVEFTFHTSVNYKYPEGFYSTLEWALLFNK